MADRYLVASGNWNSTSSWSATSGGASGASFPVAGDNVFCDAASGAVTLTVNVTSACADLTFTGFTGTLAGSAALSIGGSLTLVAGMTRSYTGDITFNATTTGKTITTNGKALANNLVFNGAGGAWTLQDAISNTGSFTVTTGTLDTNDQTVSMAAFVSTDTGTRAIDLGSSSVTLSSTLNFSGSNLTLTSGTSTISQTSSSSTFAGNGLTFYNVTNSNTSGTWTITGANTFNNLTRTNNASVAAVISFAANQTINGTFTVTSNSPSNRIFVQSNTVGTARTVTAAAVSFTDVDFQDITGAGAASPFTGTRLGDCKGNSGITFTAAADKYYVGNTANWDGTVWALASGGAAGANNFPLAQDTCIFDANSFSADGQTVSLGAVRRIGTLDFSQTDQAFTFATSSATGTMFFGDVTLDSNVTVTGGSNLIFAGRTTQVFTSAGRIWDTQTEIISPGGALQLADALTMPDTRLLTLTSGTFDMAGFATTAGRFSSSNSNTRAITSGGATLTLTGNNATIWSVATATNLTLNDALQINCTYSGAAGSRGIAHGSSAGGTETNSPSVDISAGTDTWVFVGGSKVNNVDFTGFTGSCTGNNISIYGDLTLGSDMTLSSTSTWTAAATSGTKTITSNGVTADLPVTFNGVGGTWQLADDMTVGSTRTTTLTAGTLDIDGNTLTTGRFAPTASSAATIKSSTNGGKIATTDTTVSATVFGSTATNLTVDRDTGTWTIEVGGNTTNARFINLGGKTWPSITITNTTAGGDMRFTNSAGTMKSLAVSNPPQTILFTAGVTYTIEDGFPSGTLLDGDVTIGSITAANHTLVKSGGGQVECEYLSISRSTATPDNTWYAGSTSTDGGNNSGWFFTQAPELMTASQGSFTLTGQDVDFTFALPLGHGSFLLDPQDISLEGLFSLDMEQGSFTLTGQATAGIINNDFARGSYTLSLQEVNEEGDFLPLIWSDNVSDTGTRLNINEAGTRLSLKVNAATYHSNTFPTIIGDGKFHHVAVTRDGSTVTFWLDGQSVGTATDSTNVSSSNAVKIGKRIIGNIDDVRVTKAARYTESFTVDREHPDN